MLAQTNTAPPPSAQPAPGQPPPKPQLFGGTVTALSDRQITVSHAAVGRSAEHRTFVINRKTKFNRYALKVKSRVTMRYQHLPEGDVALEILLQPPSQRAYKLFS